MFIFGVDYINYRISSHNMAEYGFAVTVRPVHTQHRRYDYGDYQEDHGNAAYHGDARYAVLHCVMLSDERDSIQVTLSIRTGGDLDGNGVVCI